MTGRALAAAAGWHASKISKLEHATRPASADDVRVWVARCGAEDQLPDLLAALRDVEGMYVEFRARERDGFRHIHQESLPLYERTRHFRIYEPGVIPGLFQTTEYADARLRRIAEVRGVPDDIAEAVRVRMARQQVLNSAERRFAVVLEEWALSARIGPPDMMAAQLAHLMTVCFRPNVSLGVVPLAADRTMWSSPGFWMFDDAQVIVETPTAELTITQSGRQRERSSWPQSTVSAPQYPDVPADFGVFLRNVTLTGGVAPARAYIEELLPDVLDGTVEPGRVFDRTVTLDEVADGYRAMAERAALKVLIRP